MDLRAILVILGPLSMMAVSCKQSAHAPFEQPRRALEQETLPDESGASEGTSNGSALSLELEKKKYVVGKQPTHAVQQKELPDKSGASEGTPNGTPSLELEKEKYVVGESIRFFIGVVAERNKTIPKEYRSSCALHVTYPDGTTKTRRVYWPIDGVPDRGWLGGSGFGSEQVRPGTHTLVFEFASQKTPQVQLLVEELPWLQKVSAGFRFEKSGAISVGQSVPVVLWVKNDSHHRIVFPIPGPYDNGMFVRAERKRPRRTSDSFFPREKAIGTRAEATLAPGESVAHELLLEDGYGFWGEGEYDITFSAILLLTVAGQDGRFAGYCPIRLPVKTNERFIVGKEEL